jgi:hypothetical protein
MAMWSVKTRPKTRADSSGRTFGDADFSMRTETRALASAPPRGVAVPFVEPVVVPKVFISVAGGVMTT